MKTLKMMTLAAAACALTVSASAGTHSLTASTGSDYLLDNGTYYTPLGAIDNSRSPGWAVQNPTQNETAVFEFTQDVDATGGLTVELGQLLGEMATLGEFKISVTGDDRGDFADAYSRNGDVDANWQALDINAASSDAAGDSFGMTSDGYVRVSNDKDPDKATYTLSGVTSLSKVTGIRIDVRDGRGNADHWVLTSLLVKSGLIDGDAPALLPEPQVQQVDLVQGPIHELDNGPQIDPVAAPSPSAAAAGLALMGLLGAGRRRRSA
jgi:MYXO-CTERM domain-containing protein